MNPTDLRNKSILILGAGKTGLSCAMFLIGKCKQIFLSESNKLNEDLHSKIDNLKAQGVKIEFGQNSNEFIEACDLAIISPGISPQTEVIKKLRSKNIPLISDVELASYFIDKLIIGITGTNGKTTTTTLITHILNIANKKAVSCGNIGTPILDIVKESKNIDCYVIELSSYQIYYSENLSCKIAACLNITPDHLDWHEGFDNYIIAKRKLFEQQRNDSWTILNLSDQHVKDFPINANGIYFSTKKEKIDSYKNIAFTENGALKIKFEDKIHNIINIDHLKILGEHNIENCLVAISVATILGINNKLIAEGLESFEGVEHRLEYVTSVNGIEIYNDSKATNPEATIKAIEAIASNRNKKKITLIAGGRDKNTDLKEMLCTIKKDINNVILYGEAKERFKFELEKAAYTSGLMLVNTLDDAVTTSLSSNTDIILFSPACSSFDMFKNYEERGEKFKQIIRKY